MCNADMPSLLQMKDRDVVTLSRISISLGCRLAGSGGGRRRSQTLTILVPAAQRVEGLFPQDDLLCDDPVAVYISFLRDVGLAEMLWGCPQVCIHSVEMAEFRGETPIGLQPAFVL